MKPRGFCANNKCYPDDLNPDDPRKYSWNLGANLLHFTYFTDNKSINDCPHCLHALVWSREYVFKGSSIDKAKYYEKKGKDWRKSLGVLK